MEKLPAELFENILLHLDDSLPGLLSISLVSRKWYSLINDELFLNKWAHRHFARHPAILLTCKERYREREEEEKETDKRRMDSDCIPPPFPHPTSSSINIYAECVYRSISIPAIQEEYTLAFWIFTFPGKGEFSFRVNSKSTDQLLNLTYDKDNCSAHIYTPHTTYFAEDLLGDLERPWRYFVVTVRQGEEVSLWFNSLNYQLETHSHSRSAIPEGDFVELVCSWRFYRATLADIRLFPFCLTPVEICSIYEQECPFNVVKLGIGRKDLLTMRRAAETKKQIDAP